MADARVFYGVSGRARVVERVSPLLVREGEESTKSKGSAGDCESQPGYEYEEEIRKSQALNLWLPSWLCDTVKRLLRNFPEGYKGR